jgi:hypothetical protein
MKKIKDILNEFREDNGGGGGRNSGGNDEFERIKQFMQKTPFTHTTTNGDEIHFHDSNHAANTVAKNLAIHEMGRIHANKVGNSTMHEYFLSSAGTHDDVLDAISNHIMNHPKLPYDLIDHVPNYIEHLQSKNERSMMSTQNFASLTKPPMPNISADIGKNAMERHYHEDIAHVDVHPHLYNDTHHLQETIKDLQNDPDEGYFISSEERK